MRSPVLPGLYADPNIVVFGDTFYIYPTTDGYDGWTGTQFPAFSSKDLVHWTDHGVILDLGPDVCWADSRAWAPTIASTTASTTSTLCADRTSASRWPTPRPGPSRTRWASRWSRRTVERADDRPGGVHGRRRHQPEDDHRSAGVQRRWHDPYRCPHPDQY